jgi:hypothetical protein
MLPAVRIVGGTVGLVMKEREARREDAYHIAPLLMMAAPMPIPRARNLRLEREEIA